MHDNFTLAAAEFNFKPDGSFYDLFRLSFTSTQQARMSHLLSSPQLNPTGKYFKERNMR